MSEKLFERARKIGGHIQTPSLTVLLRDMIKEIERLNEVERQRDQLLAALKEAALMRKNLCEHGDENSPPTPAEAYDKPLQKWLAAIAAAEG